MVVHQTHDIISCFLIVDCNKHMTIFNIFNHAQSNLIISSITNLIPSCMPNAASEW